MTRTRTGPESSRERRWRDDPIPRMARSPNLSSLGFTPVRSAHPVRAKDDSERQVSWLAGHRRFVPPSQNRNDPNGMMARGYPLTVAGAAGVFNPVPVLIPGQGEPVAHFRIVRMLHCVNQIVGGSLFIHTTKAKRAAPTTGRLRCGVKRSRNSTEPSGQRGRTGA